jgi:competence protein ComEA
VSPARWLAALLALGGLAWLVASAWPRGGAGPLCPDGGLPALDDAGVVTCGPGRRPGALLLTLGLPLDLNAASVEDLSRAPGVSEEVARRLVERRTALGRFASWDEVDEVPGVGEARLAALQSCCTLGPGVADAGKW